MYFGTSKKLESCTGILPHVNKVLRVPKKEMWQSEDEAERDAAMENKDKKANLLDMPDTRRCTHACTNTQKGYC